jgi:hypothetical protein
MALPRKSGGKCDVKDLKLERVFPKTSLRPLLSSCFFVASSSPSPSCSMMESGALNKEDTSGEKGERKRCNGEGVRWAMGDRFFCVFIDPAIL